MKHRQSIRLKHFDYSTDGFYFVTICTHNREHFFGEIKNDAMQLNPCGEIVQQCWQGIPIHFPHARIDEFVIMPNHVHGIVIINHSPTVGNCHGNSLQPRIQPRRFQLIPVIISQFKSSVTRIMRDTFPNHHPIIWQRSFHDRIIRDDAELNRIRAYIQSNPVNWALDAENMAEP